MGTTGRRIGKQAGIGLLAGLLAGLILGAGGRLAMTAIAVAAGLEVGFSLGGTLEVFATGLLIGAPAGLVFVFLKNYAPIPAVWRGGAFGALLFLGLVLFPLPAARGSVEAVGQLPLTLALFGALFVAYGIAVSLLVERLVSRLQ